MPANLKDLKGRIKSVKSTQQITKAMKLVSTAKLGRAQANVVQARPYSKGLSDLASRLTSSLGEEGSHPLMKQSAGGIALVVVLSSERGLCGGYNSNIFKQAARTVDSLEAEGNSVHVVCIGKKAFHLMQKRWGKGKTCQTLTLAEFGKVKGEHLTSGMTQLTIAVDKPNFEIATQISDLLEDLYTSGAVSRLEFVFSRFQSALTQVPSTETLLPISKGTIESVAVGPIFEPSVLALVGSVLPRYLATRIYQALLEAIASEHGARMTAMDNATRNAKDLEKRLQITYQRARQAAITTELIEIISGAEAL